MSNTVRPVRFFPLRFSRTVWWVEMSPQSRPMDVLLMERKTLGRPAFSPLHERGNVVLVQGLEPRFETVTSSPTPPFSREGKPDRERRRIWLTGSESQHPPADSNFYCLTVLHEQKPIQKSTHRNTDTEMVTTNTVIRTPPAHIHIWAWDGIIMLVMMFSVLTSSSLNNSYYESYLSLANIIRFWVRIKFWLSTDEILRTDNSFLSHGTVHVTYTLRGKLRILIINFKNLLTNQNKDAGWKCRTCLRIFMLLNFFLYQRNQFKVVCTFISKMQSATVES